ESQAKKQIRGNIYLAKVTRVEPSLQAAFIDYGGNRHGFLAFSEIHPDYYQIPVADRLALLEEEAREASENDDDEDGGRSRRRSNRTGGERRPQGGSRNDRPARGASARDNGDDAPVTAEADEDEDGFIEEPEEVTEIVHGRVSDAEDADIVDDDSENASDDMDQAAEYDDGDEPGRSMAAMVETDSISEPAPEEGDDDGAPEAEAAAEEKPKAKRKPAARKRKTKAEKAAEEAAAAEAAEAEAAEAAGHADMIGESEVEPASTQHSDMVAESEEPVTAKRDRGSEEAGRVRGVEEEEVIDSVGQEDAMEEVPFRRKLRRQYKIQEVIKRRQIMLVQVVKEERGNKGAALTTYLSLAGRYSVLMPNTARGGGISRKITNANDRKRLKAIAQELEVPRGMGVILRTAGAMRTKAEIKRDFEYLMRLWENVRTLTLSSTAPCLVYEEGSLIKRSIRDLYDKDTGEVIVSGEAGYREAKDFMRMLMPSHAKNVKPYMEEQALFARFGVEQQLDRLLTPQVTLKSGGYIVMNQTEALVSIDVNSGRSTREHSIEDTALQTNLEAADEVARQLRLRDLAGLIVIDFIDR
ncbi:MAG TPA: Rne/Rng family ribonuclease, partial [Rhizobiaceae bacterium]|nr:Rne/Rng family ribonuclease [Rhizobiaceae bacterium]